MLYTNVTLSEFVHALIVIKALNKILQ